MPSYSLFLFFSDWNKPSSLRVCLGRAVCVVQKSLTQQSCCWPGDRCRVALLPKLINPAKAFGLKDRAWH